MPIPQLIGKTVVCVIGSRRGLDVIVREKIQPSI